MLNLKLDSVNSIIFQYSQYQSVTNLMLGPQIGIIVKNTHDIKYYKLLFNHYQDKLEALMSLYNVDYPNMIIIHIIQLYLEEIKELFKNNNIIPNHRLIKKGIINNQFNNKILPLTLDESHYGYLLQCELRSENLKNVINKLQPNSFHKTNHNFNLLSFLKLDYSIKVIESKLHDELLQIELLKLVITSPKFKVLFQRINFI